MRFAGDIFKQGGDFIKDNPWALGAAGYAAAPFMGGGLMGSGGGFNPMGGGLMGSGGGFNPRGYSDKDSGWQHLGKMFLGPHLGGLVGKDFT